MLLKVKSNQRMINIMMTMTMITTNDKADD